MADVLQGQGHPGVDDPEGVGHCGTVVQGDAEHALQSIPALLNHQILIKDYVVRERGAEEVSRQGESFSRAASWVDLGLNSDTVNFITL